METRRSGRGGIVYASKSPRGRVYGMGRGVYVGYSGRGGGDGCKRTPHSTLHQLNRCADGLQRCEAEASGSTDSCAI